MEAVLTGISGMLLEISALCSLAVLSCLRDIHSCGGHSSLGSHSWVCAGQSTGDAVQTSSLATTDDSNVPQHSIRGGTAPWATVSTAAMEAVLAGISGTLFLKFLHSVLWLSCLVYGGFVAAVAAVVSVLTLKPALAVCCCFFSFVPIKPHFDCPTRLYPLSALG